MNTPFNVPYEKICNHLRETVDRFIRVIRHAEKKNTFITANIKVINTILKVNRDNKQKLKCKHYSLTFLWHCLQFNSIPGQL